MPEQAMAGKRILIIDKNGTEQKEVSYFLETSGAGSSPGYYIKISDAGNGVEIYLNDTYMKVKDVKPTIVVYDGYASYLKMRIVVRIIKGIQYFLIWTEDEDIQHVYTGIIKTLQFHDPITTHDLQVLNWLINDCHSRYLSPVIILKGVSRGKRSGPLRKGCVF